MDSGLFRPSPTDLRVVIELSPYGRWVAEYYPCEEVTELGEGRAGDPAHTRHANGCARLALRLGEDGSVVGPAEVVADVRREAARRPGPVRDRGRRGPARIPGRVTLARNGA